MSKKVPETALAYTSFFDVFGHGYGIDRSLIDDWKALGWKSKRYYPSPDLLVFRMGWYTTDRWFISTILDTAISRISCRLMKIPCFQYVQWVKASFFQPWAWLWRMGNWVGTLSCTNFFPVSHSARPPFQEHPIVLDLLSIRSAIEIYNVCTQMDNRINFLNPRVWR